MSQVEQTSWHATKQQDQISNFPYTLPKKFKHKCVPPCIQYLLNDHLVKQPKRSQSQPAHNSTHVLLLMPFLLLSS